MKRINHTKILNTLAFLLLIIVSTNVVYHVNRLNDFGEALWYCNVSAFILVIGIFLKNRILINAILATAVVTQFAWIADFILSLFGSGSGRTEIIFESGYFVLFLSTLLHSFVIPLSFYASYIYGYTTKSIYFAIGFFAILLTVTYLYTDIVENRNCVFYPCDMTYNEYLIAYKEQGSKCIYGTYLNLVREIVYWTILVNISNFILGKIFEKLGKKV